MRQIILLIGVLFSCFTQAQPASGGEGVSLISIPYMERPSPHRVYADTLLQLALELSSDRYGPYELVRQPQETVIRRQLLTLEQGDSLSVAVSMPSPEWQERAQMVPFPIMKGLASYRLFFARESNLARYNQLSSLSALKSLAIGQLPGWSTNHILEDNGFRVVYGSQYRSLFAMLKADRFQLLMRGIYEIEPELQQFQSEWPELAIVDGIAVYTYLPMYFFVSKHQPELAERLTYGLHQAQASGALDRLFEHYFADALALLERGPRRVFYLDNTTINASFYERDRPYLLDSIQRLEQARP